MFKYEPWSMSKSIINGIMEIGIMTIVDGIVQVACPSISRPLRICVAIAEAGITMATGSILIEKVTDPIIDIMKQTSEETKEMLKKEEEAEKKTEASDKN